MHRRVGLWDDWFTWTVGADGVANRQIGIQLSKYPEYPIPNKVKMKPLLGSIIK